MHLSFRPEHIVSEGVSDAMLLGALQEAFDLRLRRHDEPKTAELKRLMLEVIPLQEIESLGMAHLPYFLDCYSAWIILEYLKRKGEIELIPIDLQKIFDFEYLDAIVRKHEKAYVSLIQKVRNCAN